MAKYDFFEMTELPFDPPEKAERKIRQAIEKAQKKLQGQQGSASQDAEREEISEKLRFLEQMRAELFDGGGLSQAMGKMASEKTAEVRRRLAAAVELSKFGRPSLIVTLGAMRAQKRNTRLSLESIESVYQEKGFTIVKTDPLSAYPKFPTNADGIYADLSRLRGMKDPNPNGLDTSRAEDLYAFSAYISGEPENGGEYRTRSTADLARLLGEYATRNAARNDPLGKLCVSIATKGKTYVFNKEENRKAYEQHLLYKSPQLVQLFTLLRDVPEADKRSARFADNCVKQIAAVFGDSDAALAIYNREAGLQDDPYLPEAAVYYVPCARCGTLCQFPTFEDARRANRCTQCGGPLFKSCPKCGKHALASLDRCPECGFLFNNTGLFDKYIGLAEAALLRGDVNDARHNLGRARSADPGGTARTAELEQRIQKMAQELEIPLRRLQALMDERKYTEAARLLPQIARAHPGLDLSKQERAIRQTLADCRTRFQSVRTGTRGNAVRQCQEILLLCADFTPALDYLRETPPPPPASVHTALDSDSGAVFLSWSGCGEPGVTYCVVRREGSIAPRIPQDGQTLCASVSGLSWTDSTAEAGRIYAYSVFSLRAGSHSASASECVKTLVSVSHPACQQRETCIHVTWTAPSGCQGVSVRRRVDGGAWEDLGTHSGGYYDDMNVRRGSLCQYLLTAKYSALGDAPGVHTEIRPTVLIDSFTISLKPVSPTVCEISWDIPSGDVDLRILVDGKVKERVSSGARRQRVATTENQFHTISAEACSGGKWIRSSNTAEFNSFQRCEAGNCQVSERTVRSTGGTASAVEFSIPIAGTIPASVTGFDYAVRTRTNQSGPAPYLTREELSAARDKCRTSMEQYRRDGHLRFTAMAQDEETYYLTLCTVYGDGNREILSDPYRKKIPRPLIADVFWKVSSGLFQKPRLSVEITGNRPFSLRPRFLLCAAPGGGRLLSPQSPDALLLLDLPEEGFSSPCTSWHGEYILDTRLERKLPLFLFQAEQLPSEQFHIRWAAGFKGTL